MALRNALRSIVGRCGSGRIVASFDLAVSQCPRGGTRIVFFVMSAARQCQALTVASGNALRGTYGCTPRITGPYCWV
jgi:hypothetical protein